MRARPRSQPVAVVDIGSNSGRVAVFERDVAGHLRLLAGCRAPLRLVRDVDTLQQLSEDTMARAIDALREFRAVAAGAGAVRTIAVGTAAMRDAANRRLFLDRVEREVGVCIRILNGHEELVSALLRRAGNRHADIMSMRDGIDARLLDRAAVIVALAEEIETRWGHGRRVSVDCQVGRQVTITVRRLLSRLATGIGRRFEHAFDRQLLVRSQG